MASITITWVDEGANTTHEYVHNMTDENLERIIEAGRLIYGQANAETMLVEPVSKNRSRRMMVREAVREWKDRARQVEITIAQTEAVVNIAPIDSTETNAEEG